MATSKQQLADAIADIDRAIARLSVAIRRTYTREAQRIQATREAMAAVSVAATRAVQSARLAQRPRGPFTGLYGTINGIAWTTRITAATMGQERELRYQVDRIAARLARGEIPLARAAAQISERLRALVRSPLKRIVETELYAAAKEATLNAFANDAGVGAVRWVTTSPVPCPRCFALRETDWYGLGAGVYPITRLPRPPHPHCKCRLVPVRIDRAIAGAVSRRDIAPVVPAAMTRAHASRLRAELLQLFRESDADAVRRGLPVILAASKPVPPKATALQPESSTSSTPAPFQKQYFNAAQLRTLGSIDYAADALAEIKRRGRPLTNDELRYHMRERLERAITEASVGVGPRRVAGERFWFSHAEHNSSTPGDYGAYAVFDQGVVKYSADATRAIDAFVSGKRDDHAWGGLHTALHERFHGGSGMAREIASDASERLTPKQLEARRWLEEALVEYQARRMTALARGGDEDIGTLPEVSTFYREETYSAQQLFDRLGPQRFDAIWRASTYTERIALANTAALDILDARLGELGVPARIRRDVRAHVGRNEQAFKWVLRPGGMVDLLSARKGVSTLDAALEELEASTGLELRQLSSKRKR